MKNKIKKILIGLTIMLTGLTGGSLLAGTIYSSDPMVISNNLTVASNLIVNGNGSFSNLNVNGNTVVTNKDIQRSFIISNPTTNSCLPLWRVPNDSTITAVHLLCRGGGITGQLWLYNINGVDGTNISTNMIGIVNTNVDSSVFSYSVSASNYIGWVTSSTTGTPTYSIISFEGYNNN
jgi:hypothetical protein